MMLLLIGLSRVKRSPSSFWGIALKLAGYVSFRFVLVQYNPCIVWSSDWRFWSFSDTKRVDTFTALWSTRSL